MDIFVQVRLAKEAKKMRHLLRQYGFMAWNMHFSIVWSHHAIQRFARIWQSICPPESNMYPDISWLKILSWVTLPTWFFWTIADIKLWNITPILHKTSSKWQRNGVQHKSRDKKNAHRNVRFFITLLLNPLDQGSCCGYDQWPWSDWGLSDRPTHSSWCHGNGTG